jgi:hypothetical protein
MAAGYVVRLGDFLTASVDEIKGQLLGQQTRAGFSSMRLAQATSWEAEICILAKACQTLLSQRPKAADWHLLLEYEIPRRDRRIDAVILAHDLIIVIEFKIGATAFTSADQWQTLAYALDLRDFHEESRNRQIVPILVASDAAPPASPVSTANGALVSSVSLATPDTLTDSIITGFDQAHQSHIKPIDIANWNQSAYRPTPSIIEAAQALFAGQEVRDLSHRAAHNLTDTTDCIVKIIHDARAKQKRVVGFVTGIPGAGKTLAGLNAVHDARVRSDSELRGMFLSGNGPLVKIIREALARDCRSRGINKAQASREVSTFIASVHGFINEYGIAHPDRAPDVHVIVFDEAQRAWNAKETNKKHTGVNKSEPALALEIMERATAWSVIIALVGGGQEINRGEGGLAEWGRALNEHASQWHVAVSPAIVARDEAIAGHTLFEQPTRPELTVTEKPNLHLAVNVRAPRARWLGGWVNAILDGSAQPAPSEVRGEFPVALTRSLATARLWLRSFCRSGERAGLLASSGALRLRAEGIELSQGFRRGFPYTEWFLANSSDLRASDRLEVAASEFECQGLELDWTCVCWGGDFVFDYAANAWRFRALKGTGWDRVRKFDTQRYITNKYRVLLTRARQGMIICIPKGSEDDSTREPALFDATAEFIASCGVPQL